MIWSQSSKKGDIKPSEYNCNIWDFFKKNSVYRAQGLLALADFAENPGSALISK